MLPANIRTPPETIAQGRTAEIETIIDERNERESEPAELDPIATLTLKLRSLGKLKELELFSRPTPRAQNPNFA